MKIHTQAEQLGGVWANAAAVRHSPHEFTIDFLRCEFDDNGQAKTGLLVQRVNMSPLFVSQLISALQENWSKYAERAMYRWAERDDPPPWAPIAKPLSESRVLLVGSGGIYRHGQVAFHTKDDTSIRMITADTPTSELRTAHFAYDQTDARDDANCVFPLDRLRDLAADGVIGGLTSNCIAFMGGIYSTRRLEEETAPMIVEQCRSEAPDLVLLVPV